MAEATQALDLNSMSVQELHDLSRKATEVALEKDKERRAALEKEELKAHKELLASPKYKKLKEQYKALVKRGDALVNKGGKFTINVPIEVSYDMQEFDFHDLEGDDDTDPIDRFSFEMEGKLGASKELSKKQREILQPNVEDYVRRACGEILRLAPEDTLAEHRQFLKDAAKFFKTVSAQEVDIDDLQ